VYNEVQTGPKAQLGGRHEGRSRVSYLKYDQLKY
jgi:hypothetical protein